MEVVILVCSGCWKTSQQDQPEIIVSNLTIEKELSASRIESEKINERYLLALSLHNSCGSWSPQFCYAPPGDLEKLPQGC
jgi:hypothetical protein